MKRRDKLTLQLPSLNSRAGLISRLVPNVRKLLEGSTVTVRLKMNKLECRRRALRGWKERGRLSKSVEAMRDGKTGQKEETGRAR